MVDSKAITLRTKFQKMKTKYLALAATNLAVHNAAEEHSIRQRMLALFVCIDLGSAKNPTKLSFEYINAVYYTLLILTAITLGPARVNADFSRGRNTAFLAGSRRNTIEHLRPRHGLQATQENSIPIPGFYRIELSAARGSIRSIGSGALLGKDFYCSRRDAHGVSPRTKFQTLPRHN